MTMTRRLLCWLSGFGVHRIDLVAASYGARFICERCGKDCDFSTLKVGRP